VDGFAGVVLGDAVLEIGSYADVPLIRESFALKKIDVVDVSPPSPRLRRASCFAPQL